jgi:hypothetical protein|tara:strand:+ start:2397 stop:5039 length:2643 start_codon:yes stop_codon:yes gene_type:complete
MDLTNEQLAEAIRRADALAQQGDEQARLDAIALSQEYQKRVSQPTEVTKEKPKEPQVEEGPSGFMPFLNKAIATTFGAPFDITNAALNLVGLGTDRPIGGSKSIRQAMGLAGIETPERAPETFAERAGQVGGELASFMIPGAAATKALSQAPGTTGRVFSAMQRELIERPGRALTAETLAVPGIATARTVAEEQGFSPTQQMLAEIAGGIAPGAVISTTTRPLKLGAAALVPFTKSGAKVRASRRMQELVADPAKAAQRIDDLKGSKLLPSARTEEPGLMALEQAVIKETPQAQATMTIKRAEIINSLKNEIRKSGNIKNTRKFLQARIGRLNKAIDARIERAAENVEQSLLALNTQGLDPIVAKQASNKVVRDALEEALADARVQEEELWSAIPQALKGKTSNTRSALQKEIDNLSTAQQDDIPTIARTIIESDDFKVTSVKEIDGLYRKLGEEATRARAAGDFNKARISENLRSAILADLDNFGAKGAGADSLKAARAYSRQLNEKFRRGPIGNIMGFSREGGEKIARDLTIPTIIGTGGVKGRLGVEALQKAVDDPTALEGITNYLKADFAQSVLDPNTGRVNPAKYETFIRRNAEILELVPSTRQQLASARSAEDVLRRVTKKGDGFRKTFDKPSVSVISRLVNSPIDKEIQKVLVSPNPVESMSSLVRAARKDKSGQAMEGLKAGLSEYLIDTVSVRRTDVLGRPVIDANRLRALLLDENFSDPLRQVFNKKEMANITNAVKQMAAVQKQAATRTDMAVIGDRAGFILEKLFQIVGAKVGAKASSTAGGSIQSANIGSTAARKFLNNLVADKAKAMLIDAIEDPKLMKVLLTHKLPSKANERVIRNYILSPIGSRLADEATIQEAKRELRTEGRK